MKRIFLVLRPLALCALLLPAAALAQSAPRPDPLHAKAAVAPLVYRSAFGGYKPLAEATPPPLDPARAEELDAFIARRKREIVSAV